MLGSSEVSLLHVSLQVLNRGLRKCLSLHNGSLSFETCDLSQQVGFYLVKQKVFYVYFSLQRKNADGMRSVVVMTVVIMVGE